MLLSMVKQMGTVLTVSGWDNVTLTKDYPEDDSKIVMPADYDASDPDNVAVPAISLVMRSTEDGSLTGLGELPWHTMNIGIFLYGSTNGQEADLRTFIASVLYDLSWSVYDYNENGYPGTGSETELSSIFVDHVTAMPAHNPQHPNAAARYGGVIIATLRAVRS